MVDVNREMLAVGRDRAIDRGLLDGVIWVAGDAEALPVATGSVDAFTIAFCIRNVTHIERALAEAARVLRPGGRFLCLEFSRVAMPVLDRLYDTYSFAVLPVLGRLVAGDAEAYRYLAESIRRFPSQDGVRPDDRRSRPRAGPLPQSFGRHRRPAFGLADLRQGRPADRDASHRSQSFPRVRTGLDPGPQRCASSDRGP